MAWMISWLLHVNNRWSKSSVAWQLDSRATWTCAAVIYLLLWTESDPCSCETDKGGGGVNFAEGREMPTVAQLHQEQKTKLLTDPLAFRHSWRQIKDLMLSYLPAALLTAHQFLWVQWSVCGHELPCPRSQGTPRLPQPTLAQPQAQPCCAQGCLLVRLCCASRGSCSAQEGHEVPLVLFSASPCTPIHVCNVYITAETGKSIRCVQAGWLSLCKMSLCELSDGQKRPPAFPQVCCTLLPSGQPSTRNPLLLSLPSSSLHLLESQPAFIFAAFRNLGCEAHLRFASLE